MISRQWIVRIGFAVMCTFVQSFATGSRAGETQKKETKDQEKKLTKQQVPPVVIAAFQKAYPKASFKGASQEIEDSTTYVEIESTEGSVKRDVIYTVDGKVVEIEESVTIKQLPDAVRQAIVKDYAKAKIEKTERVTKGTNITYEFVLVTGEHKTEVVMDSSGKTLKTEQKDRDEDND